MIDKEAMIKIDFTAKLTENVNPEDSQKILIQQLKRLLNPKIFIKNINHMNRCW